MAMITHSSLSLRYARSLYDVASSNGAFKAVAKDVDSLSAQCGTDAFSSFVQDISVDKQSQVNVIAAIAKKTKYHALTVNFLKVLVQNNRLNMLPEIIDAFYYEHMVRDGVVKADVTFAEAPTQKQEKDLQKSIEAMTGQKVIIDAKMNPDLLGGVVVKVGSFMIDDSVRGKLNRLHGQMTGTLS